MVHSDVDVFMDMINDLLENRVEVKEEKVNLFKMLVVSLGSITRLHDKIEEVHNKNKPIFVKYLIQSDYKNMDIFSIITHDNVIAIRKLIGICSYSKKNNDYIYIEEIIRTYCKPLVNYCKKTSEINIPMFLKKYNFDIDNMGEIEIFTFISCMFFIGVNYNRDFSKESFVSLQWANSFLNSFNVTLDGYNNSNDFLNCNETNIRNIYNTLHISSDIFPTSVSVFFDNISEYEIDTVFHSLKKNKYESKELYHKVRDEILNNGCSKYISAYSGVFSILGLEPNTVFNEIHEKPYFDNILNICDTFFDDYNIDEENEKIMFIMSVFFMSEIFHLYQNIKNSYLSLETQELLIMREDTILLLEKEKKEKTKIMDNYSFVIDTKDKEISELKSKIKSLEQANKKLVSENNKLNKQNSVLSLSISEESNDMINTNLEPLQLSEFSHSEKTLTTEEKIQYINNHNYKLCFFGGHNTTRNRVETVFNNVSLFDKNTQDVSTVFFSDFVFINTDWFSHSLGSKIIPSCKKNNIPYFFISGTNFDYTVTQIYDYIITYTDES